MTTSYRWSFSKDGSLLSRARTAGRMPSSFGISVRLSTLSPTIFATRVRVNTIAGVVGEDYMDELVLRADFEEDEWSDSDGSVGFYAGHCLEDHEYDGEDSDGIPCALDPRFNEDSSAEESADSASDRGTPPLTRKRKRDAPRKECVVKLKVSRPRASGRNQSLEEDDEEPLPMPADSRCGEKDADVREATAKQEPKPSPSELPRSVEPTLSRKVVSSNARTSRRRRRVPVPGAETIDLTTEEEDKSMEIKKERLAPQQQEIGVNDDEDDFELQVREAEIQRDHQLRLLAIERKRRAKARNGRANEGSRVNTPNSGIR